MTDNKSWLWRKKSSDKTALVAAEKEDLVSKEHEQQIQALLAQKTQIERDNLELGDKLSSALSECTAKDEIVNKHAKTAKEALAGWEKAEAKSLSLKEELDEAVKQRHICEERARHLDSALKECMQQLRFVREDQEQRIHDVLLKASEELQENKMFFEQKLEQSSQNIAQLSEDNSELGKMLMLKEQLIEDLSHQIAKREDDVNALLTRLNNVEKDNNTLRYEVRVLEKEVDIRNEEKEFNRRTADATQKNHLENVKKIAKLESECQRLRVLVQKRLPGPAAMAKMKSEVGMLPRRKLNLNASLSDYGVKNYLESPEKKANLLSERILALEDENSSLREALQKHLNELQTSRNMYVKTATKLSQVEAQLAEFPKHDLSLALMSDFGSDDNKGSWASSWASPCKSSVAISDINHFMDDFAEMEKLALVCIDNPAEKSPVSKSETGRYSLSESEGKELVPVSGVIDSEVKSNQPLESRLRMSISKLVDIIEGINLKSEDFDPQNFVRIFQWKTSDLGDVLQKFLRTCDELLNGKSDFETFTQVLTFALEWVINHCFSLQDVSIMKDAIKKQFGWDETRSESEIEACLQVELQALRESKAEIDDQFESNVMMIEDLNVQLVAVRCNMREAYQNFVTIERELMSKVNQCEELEVKCLDLQVQLESATKMDTSHQSGPDKKKLQTEWEISAASEKLAECQETILHLGKQLKAMTTPHNFVISDKSTTNVPTLTGQRSSLLDKMQADEDYGLDQLDQSPETKEIISAKEYNSGNNALGSLAIAPYKKQQTTTSSGLFKKLLWRKKKSSNKRMQLSFAI
ncbi:hypothetical protein KSS87_013209 [Heliosperma pusillum]|nr:hypothetical protein KSS87_013209 [Heliosperma pusillum]